MGAFRDAYERPAGAATEGGGGVAGGVANGIAEFLFGEDEPDDVHLSAQGAAAGAGGGPVEEEDAGDHWTREREARLARSRSYALDRPVGRGAVSPSWGRRPITTPIEMKLRSTAESAKAAVRETADPYAAVPESEYVTALTSASADVSREGGSGSGNGSTTEHAYNGVGDIHAEAHADRHEHVPRAAPTQAEVLVAPASPSGRAAVATATDRGARSADEEAPTSGGGPDDGLGWDCRSCTFHNPRYTPRYDLFGERPSRCAMCGAEANADVTPGAGMGVTFNSPLHGPGSETRRVTEVAEEGVAETTVLRPAVRSRSAEGGGADDSGDGSFTGSFTGSFSAGEDSDDSREEDREEEGGQSEHEKNAEKERLDEADGVVTITI